MLFAQLNAPLPVSIPVTASRSNGTYTRASSPGTDASSYGSATSIGYPLERTHSGSSYNSASSHSSTGTVYPIDQLLLLASSPLVAKEHRYVEHVLAHSGLPQILRSNRSNRPKSKRSGKKPAAAAVPAPSKVQPVRSTAYGKQHPIGQERRGSNSGNGSGVSGGHLQMTHQYQQQHQGRGASSSTWKHSWNEVVALQSWRS